MASKAHRKRAGERKTKHVAKNIGNLPPGFPPDFPPFAGIPGVPVVGRQREELPDCDLAADNEVLLPQRDLVYVENISSEKTRGGIVVPDEAQASRDDSRWRVLAVGPGRPALSGETVPTGLKVGDIVILNLQWGRATAMRKSGQVERVVCEFSAVVCVVQ